MRRGLMKERRETEKHDDKGREVRDISATGEGEGYAERRGEKDAFARDGLTSDGQGRGSRDRDSEHERRRGTRGREAE